MPHATFTPEALGLIVRAELRVARDTRTAILRRARNLCVATLVEAVRDRVKTVDLKQVNRVLLQPHWREHRDAQQ